MLTNGQKNAFGDGGGSTYHVGIYPAVGEVLGNDNVRKTRHSSFVYIKK